MGWQSPSGQCWCREMRTQRGPAPSGTKKGKQGLLGKEAKFLLPPAVWPTRQEPRS